MENNLKKAATPPQRPSDFALWREFQEGLSVLLDIPIALYEPGGALVVPPSGKAGVCAGVRSHQGGNPCRETYERALAQAVENGKTYIYKCHFNQYIFAVPVFIEEKCAFVIIGGHVFLGANAERDFIEASARLGLDEATKLRIRGEIKTIPPRSIFTLPGIVNNLAVPFLKCLNMLGTADKKGEREAPSQKRLKGFYALEQVYKSLAPVLDREELYETILDKSSELVDAGRGSLMILDNKNNVLSVKAAKGLDRNIAKNIKVRLGEGISGAIAAKGLPVMVRDITSEIPAWKSRDAYKTKSFISIPLKLENRVIGVINVSDKLTGEVFSEEDLHLLLSFANYASIALERGAYYSMSEELKTLSMTDPLTGLFNRRYFRERLFEEVERVKRHNECFSTFIIDIDNFKSFNDMYGHMAGDEILKGVARAIRDAVRSMDVVARYGGEEFSVILPHTDKKDAYVIAERIRRGVEEFRPSSELFTQWPTISLGVAEFPGDASNIDELIQKADKAMYIAKRTGKNRVVVYER